jgi:lycopene cyclase domain-containing protein
MSWLYFALNVFSLSVPLWRSFEKKVYFFAYWKALWPAIIITASVFIAWDIYFTQQGIWGFNPSYLLGIYIVNLPLEEVLFFICIPYACVFSYEAINYFIKKDFLKPISVCISAILVATSLAIAIANMDKWYTCSTFFSLAGLVFYLQFVKQVAYLSKFYRVYLFILIPFFLVNGLLTGSVIQDEVVWYNDLHNLGVRLGTIPVEDTFYGMLLILLNVAIYEGLKTKFKIDLG